MIRNSVTIDWTQRESVQAGIRLKVKRILRKYHYPPDREKEATKTVLDQVLGRMTRLIEQMLFSAALYA
jgi:type I restriction enzyme, R subunit